MHLLQCCNVGNICGGTAACAWTIHKALPHWRHSILFFSPPTAETRREFHGAQLLTGTTLDRPLLLRTKPDLVMLHNTPAHRCRVEFSAAGIPALQYVHSTGPRAKAALTVACSQWLAAQCNPQLPVLYQPVPRPVRLDLLPGRELSSERVIGRICTPNPKKWQAGCLDLYHRLAPQFPDVWWEFVGAPDAVQPVLRRACGERVRFLPAGWTSRSCYWRWHALLYHHPTLTESFGRTCAEAMRAGCVPIVDRRGGFLEQVQPGQTGFLCETTEEFSRALESLSDPAVWWRMSRAAIRQADQQFSLRRFPDSLAEQLSGL